MADWQCWRCGVGLTELIFPISRRDECPECSAELHACKMCKHYAGKRANWCLEQRAEPPRDPEEANFCDYLAPRPGAYLAIHGTGDDKAKAALDELFGGPPAAKDDEDPLADLKALFKDPTEKP